MRTTNQSKNRKSQWKSEIHKEIKANKEANRRAVKKFNEVFKGTGLVTEARKGNKQVAKALRATFKNIRQDYLKEILDSHKKNSGEVSNKISQLDPKWNSVKQKIEKINTNTGSISNPPLHGLKEVLYEVPLFAQGKAMSCWHASARMLWGYKNKESIHPLPDDYARDRGIFSDDYVFKEAQATFSDLVDQLGFEAISTNMTDDKKEYDKKEISRLLSQHGPLMVPGRWNLVIDPETKEATYPGHVIVVTGINSEGKLIINDPDPDIGTRLESIEWFNDLHTADINSPILTLP